jgi:hypothetical protein
MNRTKLAAAVAEARRFIERAEALPESVQSASGDYQFVMDNFPREQGAIKRSSMDLTRALADLRRREP